VSGTDYEHTKAKDYLKQELKELQNNNKNYCIERFLQGLTSTESANYSLWKVMEKIKQIKKIHHLGYHKELGQEITLLSLNT
jgi:hypothetical protein